MDTDWKELQQKSTSAFDALNKEAKKLMAELKEEPALAKFREEYESLHSALAKSHDNERRLIKKSRELTAEITDVSEAANL